RPAPWPGHRRRPRGTRHPLSRTFTPKVHRKKQAMSEVRTERVGSTLLITIDRPQARNAVNAAVAAGLAAALDELEADPALRAGVLTGAEGNLRAGVQPEG